VYPRSLSLITAGACVLVTVGTLAACGSGGGSSESSPKGEQLLRGAGFRFRAPADWKVVRRDTTVGASPRPLAPEVVSVSVFRTTKPYDPALFQKATKELDGLAGDLAKRLHGTVQSKATTSLQGQKVRQYVIAYKKGEDDVREKITFLFKGRTEYYLLCQWKASDGEPATCARLLKTFRLG
jgi:hypothetical protein